MRSLLKRRQKLTVIGPKQHLTPQEAVAHWLRKDATVKARLYRKKGTKWLHVDDLSLIDLAQIIQEMESSLRDSYGGGQYQLKLLDVSGHLLGQYEYPIAGPVRYQDDDGDRASRGRSTKWEEMVLELLKAKFMEDPAKSLVAQMTALKALQGDNAFGNEFVSVMANNFITQKENMLDNVAKVLEVAKAMVPVQQEDPLMALAAGAMPVIGQLMMNRNAPPAAGPPQQAPAQLAAVPPPSGAQAAQDEAEEADDHDAADRRLTQLRHEITAGAEPDHLADRILLLVRTEAYDCAFDSRDPHPALAGMVMERDPMKLGEAFDSFCQAVPELSSNPELAGRIGTALAVRVARQLGAVATQEAEPAETPHAEPGMEEAEPAEAEMEAGAGDDTDHQEGELYDAEAVEVSGGDSQARDGAGEGGSTGEAAGRVE